MLGPQEPTTLTAAAAELAFESLEDARRLLGSPYWEDESPTSMQPQRTVWSSIRAPAGRVYGCGSCSSPLVQSVRCVGRVRGASPQLLAALFSACNRTLVSVDHSGYLNNQIKSEVLKNLIRSFPEMSVKFSWETCMA